MQKNPIHWVAYYGADTFPQYNEDGSENKYPDIDRSRLTAFALVKDGNQIVRFHFLPDMRLIYRRRVELRPGVGQIVAYLAGWQKTVNGVNSQSVACVFEHGGPVEIISEWADGWFDKPEFQEYEQVQL